MGQQVFIFGAAFLGAAVEATEALTIDARGGADPRLASPVAAIVARSQEVAAAISELNRSISGR